MAHTASSNNHDFYLQCAMQTERSIGELKAVVESLTKASDKHASKLEKLNEDVNKAKGALKVIGWVGGVMGAVGLALLAAVLKQLGDYVTKH